MGYLTSNLPPPFTPTPFGHGPFVECPVLYPFSLAIRWEKSDPYMALLPHFFIAEAIGVVLPDFEDWQVSVIRNDNNRKTKGHCKFRFKDAATRDIARGTLLATLGPELVLREILSLDPVN